MNDNRTTELLPCPFCGSKNVETSYKDTFSGDFRRGVYCADCCGGIYPYYDTEAEAIAAWNSRAERTCKFVSSKGSDYPPVCSACGYELGIYDCEWFEDGTYGYSGNYCQNCGAQVVIE